ncbi:MAG TPA: metal ABC transporter ATP-binding protein [Candidatus Latescibacteria bacterium]|nr:metal ABC transporter ATP-binding protein [Candidatus Latescibacterota bacterium]HRS95684.1 metal ABC transporter ATP-binding protein [Candidatus Latescibacterota bacterium]
MADVADDRNPAVEVRELSYSYQRPLVEALRGVSLTLPRGTFTAVMGPNGSGKSTFLRLLLGILRPTRGEIRVLGESPTAPSQRVQRLIAYVPQYDSINPLLPLRSKEVIALGLSSRVTDRPARWIDERVSQILEDLDLVEIRDHQYGLLSGGQKQRVLLARALALEPELLVLDEPFSAMDMTSQHATAKLLSGLVRQKGKTVITVVHGIHTIVHHLDNLVLLNREIVAAGTPDEVLRPANLTRAYGTDVPVVICPEGFRHPLVEDVHA